jgi:hypothetical protein
MRPVDCLSVGSYSPAVSEVYFRIETSLVTIMTEMCEMSWLIKITDETLGCNVALGVQVFIPSGKLAGLERARLVDVSCGRKGLVELFKAEIMCYCSCILKTDGSRFIHCWRRGPAAVQLCSSIAALHQEQGPFFIENISLSHLGEREKSLHVVIFTAGISTPSAALA